MESNNFTKNMWKGARIFAPTIFIASMLYMVLQKNQDEGPIWTNNNFETTQSGHPISKYPIGKSSDGKEVSISVNPEIRSHYLRSIDNVTLIDGKDTLFIDFKNKKNLYSRGFNINFFDTITTNNIVPEIHQIIHYNNVNTTTYNKKDIRKNSKLKAIGEHCPTLVDSIFTEENKFYMKQRQEDAQRTADSLANVKYKNQVNVTYNKFK